MRSAGSGVPSAGKTGTARPADVRRRTRRRSSAQGAGDLPHAWFIAFAPVEDPAIAIAVLIERGGGVSDNATGGRVAAPVARQVLDTFFKLYPAAAGAMRLETDESQPAEARHATTVQRRGRGASRRRSRGRYEVDPARRRRRDGRRVPRRGHPARPRGRAQDPPPAVRGRRISSSSASGAKRCRRRSCSTRTSSRSTTRARRATSTSSSWSTSRGGRSRTTSPKRARSRSRDAARIAGEVLTALAYAHRTRTRPPRHQARQHPAVRRRQGAGHRLRHRAGAKPAAR